MRVVKAGTTDVSVVIRIIDSTDGTPETGVVWNTAGIDLEYRREGAVSVDITEATLAALTTAHTDGGFLHIGNGYYRLDLPDAAVADGVTGVLVHGTVTGMVVIGEYVQLVDYDPFDGARLGLSAMPSAAAAARIELFYGADSCYASKYSGPRGPGVFYNDAAGNTNTVVGTDGTFEVPVSSMAAVKTIADGLGVNRVYLVENSSGTVPATMEDYEFVGIGEMNTNSVTLGSQDVDNSVFFNLLLTGAQGGTSRLQAEACVLSAITGMEITALGCVLAAGTLTLRNDCMLNACWSAVAGTGTPIVDINSVPSVNLYNRHYSGGWQVNNAVATTVMSFETDGQLVVDATCTSLAIAVRGNCSITDNGTTTALTQDAAVNRTNINIEADTALADYDGPTKAEMDTAHGLLATVAKQDVIDGIVDTILVDTGTTLSATLATIAGYLDTEIAAILVDTNELQTNQGNWATATGFSTHDAAAVLSAIQAAGTHLTLIKAVTDALTSAAATQLALSAGTIVNGAAVAGTLSTTQMTTNLTEGTDDHYNGRVIIWTSGVLQNQATDITDYTGATKLLTYTATTEAPSATDTFVIV